MKRLLTYLFFLWICFGAQTCVFAADPLPLGKGKFDPALTENRVTKEINGTNTQNSLRSFIKNNVTTINVVIGSVALLYLVILASRFIIDQGNEDKLSSYKKQFGWLALGLAVVSVAEYAAFDIFDPSERDVLDEGTYNNFSFKLRQAVDYFQYLIAGIALVVMGMSGYHFIIKSDDDEAINQEKRIIKSFGLGLVLILLAEAGVYIVAGGPQGDKFSTDYIVDRGIGEIGGILNFGLSFLGAAAIFMLILASLYYVISFGNEDQMNRAKRIIVGSVLGIIIAFSSYVIANFLVQ